MWRESVSGICTFALALRRDREFGHDGSSRNERHNSNSMFGVFNHTRRSQGNAAASCPDSIPYDSVDEKVTPSMF